MKLERRLEELGRTLGEREAEHRSQLEAARAKAEELRTRVEAGIERFHAAAATAGAPHLRIELEPARVDDKHLRAVQFALRRGKYNAIVTVKSRGEVTLVGPFRTGKTEGPCRSFPMDANSEIEEALGEFIGRFAEEAATP